MMSCRELTTAIASDELAHAGWRKRLSVRWHLMLCRHCRCYQRQVKALGNMVRKLSGKTPEPSRGLEETIVQQCLKESEKQRGS